MEDRIFTIKTGYKGANELDIDMVLYSCENFYRVSPFHDLSEKYKECRDKAFDIQQKYRKLRYNKVVKFLIRVRIIKL